MFFKSILPILSSCLLASTALAQSIDGCEILGEKLDVFDCTSNSNGEITNLFLTDVEIPLDIFENISLSSLEELIIFECKNSYEVVKNNIENWPNLRVLELNEAKNSNNVNFDFFEKSNLTKLRFYMYDDSEQTSDIAINFKLPATIKELNLSKFSVSQYIIDYISEFKNLEKLELYLSSNDMLNYDKFMNLTNLKEINMFIEDQNDKSEIPEFFFYLPNLENVYLNNRGIETISSKIENLKNIRLLELEGNRISNLPSTIGNLKTLQYLYLDENNISELPDEFKNLINLKTLSLNNNKFTNFPQVLENLKSLQTLDLSDNLIDDELPQYLNDFNELEAIYLSGNKNIKGKFLTNKKISHCTMEESYDLCADRTIYCYHRNIYNLKKCDGSDDSDDYDEYDEILEMEINADDTD